MEGELKTSADARPPAWRSAFRVRFALESPRRCSWHGTSGFRFSLRLLNGQTLLPVGRRVEDAGPKGRRTLEPPRPILAHASRPGRTINTGTLPPPATPGARSAPLTSRRRAWSCSASFDLDIDFTPMIRAPVRAFAAVPPNAKESLMTPYPVVVPERERQIHRGLDA